MRAKSIEQGDHEGDNIDGDEVDDEGECYDEPGRDSPEAAEDGVEPADSVAVAKGRVRAQHNWRALKFSDVYAARAHPQNKSSSLALSRIELERNLHEAGLPMLLNRLDFLFTREQKEQW